VHEQGANVLTVGATLNVGIGVMIQNVANGTSDQGEIRDCTIVHESEFSEYEGMVVDVSDGALRCSTDVSENTTGFGIGTDGTIVHVALGRLYSLVDGGSEAFVRLTIFALAGGTFFKVAVRGSVPGDT